MDVNGVYGIKGTPDSNNYPGSRFSSVSWIDSEGDLWLFGGMGNAESTYGSLNDFWKFNHTSKEWPWILGNKTVNVNGIYGIKRVPDSLNYPGGRFSAITWTDSEKKFLVIWRNWIS
ncbi:MAG: hypothetical protein GF329_10770 [Candidatus Lokiarchaeota archaeon]|nr:hypothetical protein [Candidatus Lokiarchaeota archaeon]